MPANHRGKGRIISTQTKSCDNEVCITQSTKYDYKGSAEWSDQKPPVIIGINFVEFMCMFAILFIIYHFLIVLVGKCEEKEDDKIITVTLSATLTFLLAIILYVAYTSYSLI